MENKSEIKKLPYCNNKLSDELNDPEMALLDTNYSTSQFKVLFNDVVLHRLFYRMDHSNLKICRLVCRKWREVSEPLFKIGSRILFDFSEKENKLRDPHNRVLHNSILKTCSTVTKLIEVFGGIPLEIPFTSFRLKGYVPLTISVLVDIFNNYGQFMDEVFLDNVTFPNNNEDSWKRDIGELIPPCCTKKLNITCSAGNKLMISINRLLPLRSINLNGCIVDLNNIFVKMSPNELELKNVWFIQDEERIDPVFINEVVDLQKLNKLNLFGDNYILDLSGLKNTATINHIELSETKMLNWKNLELTVNKLILSGVPFLTINQMKIKEFVFSSSSVDLSVLPKTLERLHLKFTEIKCTANSLNLPSLKYLQIEDTNNESESLHLFKNCENLDFLKLESTYGRIGLNFKNIPKNLSRMHLTQVNITGSGNYKLKELVLQNYDFEVLKNVLEKLHPEKLVVSICDIHLNYERILKLLTQKTNYKTLAVGKFIWPEDGTEEEESNFSNYVETKSNYYLFENGQQKVLQENAFQNLMI